MNELQIICQRKRYYITAEGLVKLSRGFKTESDAKAELDHATEYYKYWANSCGVSGELAMKQHGTTIRL